MIGKADELLKLALAIAALLIGSSVAYYYAIFLPQQAQAKTDHERQVALAKATSESNAATKKEKRAQDAKVKYDVCLDDAFSNYQSRWLKTCKRLNAEDLKRKSKCVESGGYYCNDIIVTPAANCSLPNELGDDYDSAHDGAKKLCLEEFKASTG